VTREAIAKLAFQKWQKRGSPNGEDQRDWFEAERELKSSQAARARRG
jgi:ribonuclease I